MATHIRDPKLFDAAGITAPLCKTGGAVLDLRHRPKLRYEEASAVTCGKCRREYRKRFPWVREA